MISGKNRVDLRKLVMQLDLGNAARDFALLPVVEDRRARIGVSIVAFVLATSFGAHVAVPLPWTPVPMTLQPLFVILAGALLGPRLGAAAMASYLAVGMGGAPVFSQGHAGFGQDHEEGRHRWQSQTP